MADPSAGLVLMVEQSITIGNIIEIVVIAAGGISVFATMRNTVRNINSKVDDIQIEIKKLSDILIAQARFDVRLGGLEQRVSAHDRRLEELSHGEGFVRGRGGIDREYP
jgi:K+/H+ antiporter YhaU regulatory subunit KhtT